MWSKTFSQYAAWTAFIDVAAVISDPFDLIQARRQIDQVLRDDAVAGKDRSLFCV
jgi:hypothetical protein